VHVDEDIYAEDVDAGRLAGWSSSTGAWQELFR
jgi:hypothetical protein